MISVLDTILVCLVVLLARGTSAQLEFCGPTSNADSIVCRIALVQPCGWESIGFFIVYPGLPCTPVLNTWTGGTFYLWCKTYGTPDSASYNFVEFSRSEETFCVPSDEITEYDCCMPIESSLCVDPGTFCPGTVTGTDDPGMNLYNYYAVNTGTNTQYSLLIVEAPFACQVSTWSSWSACSVSCGSGTQISTRTITYPAMGGGATCPALTQQQACNTEACPLPSNPEQASSNNINAIIIAVPIAVVLIIVLGIITFIIIRFKRQNNAFFVTENPLPNDGSATPRQAK